MIILTKKFKFSAAHRYHNPDWSEEVNLAAFGDDHRVHGHNYELEVSLTGAVDEETGFLADLSLVKSLVQEHVIDLLDHSQIELDIAWFADRRPTSENIIRFIWDQMEPHMPADVVLTRLKLNETPSIFAEYDGRLDVPEAAEGGTL